MPVPIYNPDCGQVVDIEITPRGNETSMSLTTLLMRHSDDEIVQPLVFLVAIILYKKDQQNTAQNAAILLSLLTTPTLCRRSFSSTLTIGELTIDRSLLKIERREPLEPLL